MADTEKIFDLERDLCENQRRYDNTARQFAGYHPDLAKIFRKLEKEINAARTALVKAVTGNAA